MSIDFKRLAGFGWSNHFQSQLTPGELAAVIPVRVLAVHRNGLDVVAPGIAARIPPVAGGEGDDESAATVGDWLLLDGEGRPLRALARKSVFRRKAAGTGYRVQLIAANVDTLFVVTSCNRDFNVARLERYLALAREAGVMPVVVLTKADLDDPAPFVGAARRLMPGLVVEALDARGSEAVRVLGGWCGPGETVALVGSSGVGKSTLVNALAEGSAQETAPIREDDAHGRHTTTGRSMHRLAFGGWLVDTPGMRELQLADAADGVAAVFADIVALAEGCRFADCRHREEPGCAVRAAIDAGALDPRRLDRFRKLAAEEARNSESLRERRARERGFGRLVKQIVTAKRTRQEI